MSSPDRPTGSRSRLFPERSHIRSVDSYPAPEDSPKPDDLPKPVLPYDPNDPDGIDLRKPSLSPSEVIGDARLHERAAVAAEEAANPDFRQEAVGRTDDVSAVFDEFPPDPEPTGNRRVPFLNQPDDLTDEELAFDNDPLDRTTRDVPAFRADDWHSDDLTADELTADEDADDNEPIALAEDSQEVDAFPAIEFEGIVPTAKQVPIEERIEDSARRDVTPTPITPQKTTTGFFDRIKQSRLGTWARRAMFAIGVLTPTNFEPAQPSNSIEQVAPTEDTTQRIEPVASVTAEAAEMRITNETAIKAGEGISQAIKRMGYSESAMNAVLGSSVQIGESTNSLLYSYVNAKPDQLGMRLTMNGVNEVVGVEFYDTATPDHTLTPDELEDYVSFDITDTEVQLHWLEDTLDEEGEGFELSRYPLEFRLDPLAAGSGQAQADVQVRHVDTNQFVTCTPELLDNLGIDVKKWKRSIGFGKSITIQDFERAATQ